MSSFVHGLCQRTLSYLFLIWKQFKVVLFNAFTINGLIVFHMYLLIGKYPKQQKKKSLFVCCCVFDLHTLLTGASDDAVSCAVMLEVLHSLANQSTPLHHGVVFLFNGAEENVLQVTPPPHTHAHTPSVNRTVL